MKLESILLIFPLILTILYRFSKKNGLSISLRLPFLSKYNLVTTDHRLSLSHDFTWENVKILDCERYLGKRLVSEMLHIQMQNNSLNLQSDTEFLHHAYIFNKLLIIYYFNA